MKTVAKFPFACFAASACVYLGRYIWICVHLRSPVAVHFSLGGEVNRWTEKAGFVVMSALVSCVILGAFGGVALFGAKIPADVSNMPRKDYWLAPERREQTQRTMSALLSWIGCGALLILGAVNEAIYRVNLSGDSAALRPALYVVGGTVIVLLAAAVVAWVRFARVPADASLRGGK
jgi:hypothetical protein